MNDFVKDTTEIPSLSFGTPEPEPELPVQQPEEFCSVRRTESHGGCLCFAD